MMNNPIATARCYSPFLSRLLDNGLIDIDFFQAAIQHPLSVDDFLSFAPWDDFQAAFDEESLGQTLRRLRRFVLSHIMVRDLSGLSDLQEVMQTITQFADFAVCQAEQFAHAYYVRMYGKPIGNNTQAEQHLSVIAMGKMGGYELNVSSDIDLIFIYPENGETDGAKSRSHQEFFTKVGQKIIALLNNNTAAGQVFRVDMRLRPDGDSGPLVLSESALEHYLITQGREWERYAWTKARVVTPHANDIVHLVRPFVYRKYLDFNAYEAMRGLHRKIRQEVERKGLKDNIKLGAGGIREIEFIAQIFQLIRGGQNKSLQLRGTQEALLELEKLGFLSTEDTHFLLDAYHFLRNIEHRLQYWDDQQTQMLPENEEQAALLAQSMNFDDAKDFFHHLENVRQKVNALFDNLLSAPEEDNHHQELPFRNVWENDDESILQTHGFTETAAIIQRLNALQDSRKYHQLSETSRMRFNQLMPHVLEVSSQFPPATRTLYRLLDFIDAIMRRSSYLALLYEYPHTLVQLAQLMSQSSWVADYLLRHPILLDELLSDQILEKTNTADIEPELSQKLQQCNDDVEEEMNTLRHVQHAQIFRLSAQDLAGQWVIEFLSDELSMLADVVLRQTMQRTWHHLPNKHTETPHFAVIAYGKLGGKELGYASDLDLVYLYDDAHLNAAATYSKYANRITSWLTAMTSAGSLYDVDLRLRPDGDSGFMVHSLETFRQYQYEKAWTWEHQALSRARFVCGDAKIGEAFEAIRKDILMRQRNHETLRQEIITMREKMFTAHPPENRHIKYARGGIVDVEFIVQYLVLAYAHQYPDLTQNLGNIALLNIAASHQLIDENLAQKVQAAYREYRRIQHNTRLRDQTFMPDDTILEAYQTVKDLWREVMQQSI